MNLDRLYEYRFRDVDQAQRAAVWREIGPFIHRQLGRPERVLDPAAGRCEFISSVPAEERWALDLVDHSPEIEDGVNFVVGDALTADLPTDYFDAVWVSNFLEHLPTQEVTASFLERMCSVLRVGGAIAVMGPNFKHCMREYFDCADHTLVYTDTSIAEHLYAAGFSVERVVPRFLPYSFRGRLPPSPTLTRKYLDTPGLWRLFGKQFLVIARVPAT